jgi:hypothetical protein
VLAADGDVGELVLVGLVRVAEADGRRQFLTAEYAAAR